MTMNNGPEGKICQPLRNVKCYNTTLEEPLCFPSSGILWNEQFLTETQLPACWIGVAFVGLFHKAFKITT